METKKRGPKPSGEKKRVLFMRVPEGLYEDCRSAVVSVALGKAVPCDSRPFDKPVEVSVPVKVVGGLKLDSVVLEQAARIQELEEALLRARSVALEPQSEDGAYWKEKYLEAKKRVEELEKMGYG